MKAVLAFNHLVTLGLVATAKNHYLIAESGNFHEVVGNIKKHFASKEIFDGEDDLFA